MNSHRFSSVHSEGMRYTLMNFDFLLLLKTYSLVTMSIIGISSKEITLTGILINSSIIISNPHVYLAVMFEVTRYLYS